MSNIISSKIIILVANFFQICIPTSEDKGLAFVICPFVFIISSMALTAFYYHQFHPGGTFKTNGPKRCSHEDNETDALYECNTLLCCNVWNCKFMKNTLSCCHVCNCQLVYMKMKRSESSVVTFHASNEHVETANLNEENNGIGTPPSFNNQNGHRVNTNNGTV